jgi:MoxR-like ATPase
MWDADDLRRVPAGILEALSAVVVGRLEIKRLLVAAFLCGGHVLIEGMPGTAKTLLGKTFARAIGGQFKRIQLTPDLLPADVTGFNLYTPDGDSRFVRGPIFANVVLADELNRTTPRTQSAFLEAMQEGQVTIEGERHELPRPFMVIASQQATGSEGTYPMTDVQSDRFMFRAWSGYPDREEEAEVIARTDQLEDLDVPAVTTPELALAVREAIKQVHVAPEIPSYIVDIVHRIRGHSDVSAGPGPRGSITLFKGARALAFLEGRDYVVPDDVKQNVHAALVHRIRLREEAEIEGVTLQAVLDSILEQVRVPTGVQ